MFRKSRPVLRQAALVVACATALTVQAAETFPNRPIRLIVPQAAGGSTDFVSRLAALELAEAFGQTVVVDNRPGANGNIGMELAHRAPRDGYTLLAGGTASVAVGPSLYSKLAFDPVRDFQAITLLVYSTSVLIAHPSVPVKTIGELVTLARAKPGSLSYASAGAGSTPHLSAEMFKLMAGVDLLHVPYKGSTPGVVDTMAGRTSIMFTGVASALPHIKAGRLKALSVNGPKRSAALPDVPTASESGLPGFEVDFWIGLFAPAGTPRGPIDRIHAAAARMLEQKDNREKLLVQGTAPVGMGPDEFGRLVRTDAARWAKVVKAAGLRVD